MLYSKFGVELVGEQEVLCRIIALYKERGNNLCSSACNPLGKEPGGAQIYISVVFRDIGKRGVERGLCAKVVHTVPEREHIYLVVAYRELIYPGLYCICAVFVDYHIFRKIRKLKPFVVGVQKGLLGIVVQNLQSVVHVALKAPQIALYNTAGGVDDCREKKEQRCHKGK